MTRPQDIPEDVWKSALQCSCVLSAQYDRHVEGIARALLARDERAAGIADSHSVEPDPDEQDPYDQYEMGGRSTARLIAAAIRNPS